MGNYQMTELTSNELKNIDGGLVLTLCVVGGCSLIAGFVAGYIYASK
jgi:lactobin A/cerein 7B family class IIb bacteriocin